MGNLIGANLGIANRLIILKIVDFELVIPDARIAIYCFLSVILSKHNDSFDTEDEDVIVSNVTIFVHFQVHDVSGPVIR